VRKVLITAMALTAVTLAGPVAPALAGPGDTTTTEVASYPPETLPETTEAEVLPPVVVEPTDPGAEVGDEGLVAGDLPATGTDTMLLLQVGTGVLVAGVITVVLVRRRKPHPAT
jgi:LPXTG-motif cell wall-anchored protein